MHCYSYVNVTFLDRLITLLEEEARNPCLQIWEPDFQTRLSFVNGKSGDDVKMGNLSTSSLRTKMEAADIDSNQMVDDVFVGKAETPLHSASLEVSTLAGSTSPGSRKRRRSSKLANYCSFGNIYIVLNDSFAVWELEYRLYDT